MVYFIYVVPIIYFFYYLVLAFILWKFGIKREKDEETTKDIALERTH